MKIKIKAKDYQPKQLMDDSDSQDPKNFMVTVDVTQKFYKDHEDSELESYEMMDSIEEKLEEIASDLDLSHIGFNYEGRPGYDFISDPCTLEHTKDLKHAIESYYGEWVSVQIIRDR